PAHEAEIDLSVVLGDITPAGTSQPAGTSAVLDGVFAQMRTDAAKRGAGETAEADLQRGIALAGAGRGAEAIEALKAASRSPRHRFQAAELLGRIYRERKALPQAIEWFERAAEAPSPTNEDGHRLLLELADALEAGGEVARALAICLELQAE